MLQFKSNVLIAIIWRGKLVKDLTMCHLTPYSPILTFPSSLHTSHSKPTPSLAILLIILIALVFSSKSKPCLLLSTGPHFKHLSSYHALFTPSSLTPFLLPNAVVVFFTVREKSDAIHLHCRQATSEEH